MDMSIDDLNRHIDMLKSRVPVTDKYSTYLYKLEREEGISEEERKAYIGIYRALPDRKIRRGRIGSGYKSRP